VDHLSDCIGEARLAASIIRDRYARSHAPATPQSTIPAARRRPRAESCQLLAGLPRN
jgi:hypothetical protein